MDQVVDYTDGKTALSRRQVVAEILRDRGSTLVVSGLGAPTYDVFAAGQNDANFYLWGAMGAAIPTGLGLALAQPDIPVMVITGDGEAMMGMGAIATVGVKQPKNLTIIVLDNGHYGETGMQKGHSSHGIRLNKIAKACNLPYTSEINDINDIHRLRQTIQTRNQIGPALHRILISTEDTERTIPTRDCVEIKNRFKASLGHVI